MTPQDNQDMGASASPSGSRPSDQAQLHGPDAPRVDPSREGLCQLCDREYRVWAAASPLWNAVVRGGSINGEEEFAFLCADCFMGLAEDRGIASLFRLRAEQAAGLEMVTPTGRVWNDEEFRFNAQQ